MKTIKSIYLGVSLLIIPFIANAQQTFTNGLVAFYPFNGNANDVVNGTHGTPFNVVLSTNRFGFPNQAYRFLGDHTSFIRLPDSQVLRLQDDFTVSAWIHYFTDVGTDSPRVYSSAGFDIGTVSTDSSRVLYFNNTTAGGGGNTVGSANSFPANQWIHLLGRRQDNILSVFVNGVKQGEVFLNPSPDYSRNFNPEIGNSAGRDTDAFGGMIDDVRLYNRALPDQEILALYNSESTSPNSIKLVYLTTGRQTYTGGGNASFTVSARGWAFYDSFSKRLIYLRHVNFRGQKVYSLSESQETKEHHINLPREKSWTVLTSVGQNINPLDVGMSFTKGVNTGLNLGSLGIVNRPRTLTSITRAVVSGPTGNIMIEGSEAASWSRTATLDGNRGQTIDALVQSYVDRLEAQGYNYTQ